MTRNRTNLFPIAGMAATRSRADEPFYIHEDVSTEDAEMTQDGDLNTEEAEDEDADEADEADEADDQDDESSDSSDEADTIEPGVQRDMAKLQSSIPGFSEKYTLLKRIGEGAYWPARLRVQANQPGTFSTVYKALDLHYDRYVNDWDSEQKQDAKWTPPPLSRFTSRSSSTHTLDDASQSRPAAKRRFVAIKKIYVTSSPQRIFNELELLYALRSCPSVCPIITAFRHDDQVIAILPYFRHDDFRTYFRNMQVDDMRIYLRELFLALRGVHEEHILHRDIKPTNFLYHPESRRGVLVDFGLAERAGVDAKPCLCHEAYEVRKHKLANSVAAQAGPQQGYPKTDTRPSRRANRAGTRGFRAPEVLFKCTEQTTAIDVWSAGVILLTILSKRFPFFNSADDVEAMVEIATIFGSRRMKAAGQLHGCMFETSIPTIGRDGFTFEKIIMWSTCRDAKNQPLTRDEKLAIEFLGRCMDLDPARRITAKEALEHEFLRLPGEKPLDVSDDDEIDMLQA